MDHIPAGTATFISVLYLLSLEYFSNSSNVKKNENNFKSNNYSKKVIFPSADEIRIHKEFMKKNFKRNFY